MTNNLTTFTFNTSNIRVVTIDGEPWFVAKDTAEALGITSDEVSKRSSRWFGDDEYRVVKKSLAQNEGLTALFIGRTPSLSLISESGLYKLIMRSDKPEANYPEIFREGPGRTGLQSIKAINASPLSDRGLGCTYDMPPTHRAARPDAARHLERPVTTRPSCWR